MCYSFHGDVDVSIAHHIPAHIYSFIYTGPIAPVSQPASEPGGCSTPSCRQARAAPESIRAADPHPAEPPHPGMRCCQIRQHRLHAATHTIPQSAAGVHCGATRSPEIPATRRRIRRKRCERCCWRCGPRHERRRWIGSRCQDARSVRRCVCGRYGRWGSDDASLLAAWEMV